MSVTILGLVQVLLDTLEYGSRIKKTPVVVGNCTGFAVNRVFFPYTQSACMLLDLGMDPYMVDKAIAGAFGMPMGPFRYRCSASSAVQPWHAGCWMSGMQELAGAGPQVT